MLNFPPPFWAISRVSRGRTLRRLSTVVLLNSQLLYNYVGSYNINNKPENFLYSDLLNAMQFAGNTVQKSVNSAQNKVTHCLATIN